MAVALDQFVKQLEDSGILAGDTIKDFIPPKASPKDAEELARELVRKKKLTKFQAEEVYKGKAKSLVLGNYVLIEKIGAGGMGQVFKARHRRMDRIVAVKLLPATMTKDQAAIARFGREVKAAAKISHPNIVAAFDADCANGIHFLVMELVEGSDLSALVKKNGPFSIANSVNYVLQAAKGLEAAHKKGIVHRDIKPANLLLDTEGTVKILDMGLARLSSDGDGTTQAELTSTGAVMGTVDYMAPEQSLETKTADARADIYALGCSLYYLLTGKATYDGDSIMAKLLAHREQSIPSLCAVRPEVPEQVEIIFRKMVSKKVEDRYQSMTEVIAELERCSGGNEETVVFQKTVGPSTEAVVFPGISIRPTKPVRKTQLNKPLISKIKKKHLLIGAGIFGVLVLLAGVVISLTTKDGTLVVTVNEPDANIEVLNEEGKIEITRKGEKGPISISVDPGKHRLKVTKDGFTVFGRDFEIESGGKMPITAKLVPLGDKPVAVGTKPAPIAGVRPPADAGVKKPLAFTTPGFDQWVKQVAGMPAEQQVQHVIQKLQELNPEFDGKETHKIENGVVTKLSFLTDNVTDISPVRAWVGLKFLQIDGSDKGKGKLSDLSPLEGMPLTTLHVSHTPVSDLAPLKGMALTSVGFVHTLVSDLSPLKEMPFLHLDLTGTRVSDLAPVRGMAVTGVICSHTLVSDLSPLKDMPLTFLHFADTTVTDLSPLQRMPLTTLVIYDTAVSDLSPLKGMRLEELDCRCKIPVDLSPLSGMPLKYLRCNFNRWRDTDNLRSIKTLETINLKPAAEFWKEAEAQQAAFDDWTKQVAAMPAEQQVQHVIQKLKELNAGFDGKETHKIENGVVTELNFLTDNVTDISPVRALAGLKTLRCNASELGKGKLSDLSPLNGMALSDLNLNFTLISDLTPLRGMPLTNLVCVSTPLSDLSPLAGMKLISLNLQSTPVSNLSPLKDMKLEYLHCGSTNVVDLSPLKNMNLNALEVQYTPVFDLSPLKDMKLTDLKCHGTKVSDLSPLVNSTITVLLCDGTNVSDLSPLKGLNLTLIAVTPKNITKGIDVIRQMKSLNNIGVSGTVFPPDEFWKKYDAGEFGKPTPPSKPITTFDDPVFQQWVKDVAALPADKQVEAVAKKLQQLNPGFDGKMTPTIEGGVVTGLQFFTDNVTDISPVRAFAGLKTLDCGGSDRRNKFSDLTPLAGLQLNSLSCYRSDVSDLSPLKGMALTMLDCSETTVIDLLPLKDMKLESLACHFSLVNDHSILSDMALKTLKLSFKPERDTKVLRSIETLETINNKPVAKFWKEVESNK